jgi:hypothetical protein
MQILSQKVFLFSIISLILAIGLYAEETSEFKIKRETDFTFQAKPAIEKSGEGFNISFEVKSFCDVTIVIEDEVLPYLVEILNSHRERSPPVTLDQVRAYLTVHETLHEQIGANPDLIDGLLPQLQTLPFYGDVKQLFLNNYGQTYQDDRAFVEEIVEVEGVLKIGEEVVVVEIEVVGGGGEEEEEEE